MRCSTDQLLTLLTMGLFSRALEKCMHTTHMSSYDFTDITDQGEAKTDYISKPRRQVDKDKRSKIYSGVSCMHLWQKSLVLNREILESREKTRENSAFFLNMSIYVVTSGWLSLFLCAQHLSREQGLLAAAVWASHLGGFSCCRAQPRGCRGFSSCGPQA